MKKKAFHQFIFLERGPANTAIIDFLSGHVFQAENKLINIFLEKKYREIPKFIELLTSENLIIEVEEPCWIPRIIFPREDTDRNDFQLEVEEGTDLNLVKSKFRAFDISKIIIFGNIELDELIPGTKMIHKRKMFHDCIQKSKISHQFGRITENIYAFNMNYNSCWGRKIAITKDGNIRPCIFSSIIVRNLKDDLNDIVEKMRMYWLITNDKINKCNICEFRYMCFNCREIVLRKNKSLYETNPYCNYDPHKGIFQ